MHNLANFLLILTLAVPLFTNNAYADKNEDPVTAMSKQPNLVNLARFKPREYCRTGGGVVSETQNKRIYLCCYESKSRCVATDIEKSISWLIPYSGRNEPHFALSFK